MPCSAQEPSGGSIKQNLNTYKPCTFSEVQLRRGHIRVADLPKQSKGCIRATFFNNCVAHVIEQFTDNEGIYVNLHYDNPKPGLNFESVAQSGDGDYDRTSLYNDEFARIEIRERIR